METVYLLWTAAPEIKVKLLVIIMLLQMVLTVWCYARMARARVAAVKAGKVSPEVFRAVGDEEPEESRVFTRLVSNQFELPVLFYALIITGLALKVTSWATVILAALFVLTRVMHAREMAGAHVVLHRRKIFIQTFRITMLLMLELLISTLFVLQV